MALFTAFIPKAVDAEKTGKMMYNSTLIFQDLLYYPFHATSR